MVILYSWAPDLAAPTQGQSPDLGHSSLQIGDVYASFWPQENSLVGTLVSLLSRRSTRQPESYAEEILSENGFMQRPASDVDRLTGLNEAAMLTRWEGLRDADFDVNSYNCSHVTRDLLAAGLGPELLTKLMELCQEKEPVPLTDCTPLGVRRAILELLDETQTRSL